jgi:hypothetical protein
MAELVNLRTARKRAKRQREDVRAAENRLSQGRPKTERGLNTARLEKAGRDLDRHRIETGDGR